MEKKRVERRIRQHDAKFADPVGDALQFKARFRRVFLGFDSFEEDDGVGGRKKHLLFRCRDMHKLADGLSIRGHHCQRLLAASLTGAQPFNRQRVLCVADEVKASDPLNRNNFAAGNRCGGSPNRVAGIGNRAASGIRPRELWSAHRAGIGLSMKATVSRIFIFLQTGRTHRKHRHGRLRTIVGKGARNRKARTAVRAVGEGVARAAIGRRKDLREACPAYGCIRSDHR